MLEQLLQGFGAMSGWEYVGVAFGLLYLLLAMKQSIWCWPAAFVSTMVYTLLFWQGALLMESALNVYYLVMAVYGYYQWRKASGEVSTEKPITTWSLNRHLTLIAITAVVSVTMGYLLQEYSHAKMAYLDSFTTCFAIVTTYLVTQKVLENWLYWVVIDIASIYLYIEMGYLPTAALFVVYTVLAVQGYRLWQHSHQQASPAHLDNASAH